MAFKVNVPTPASQIRPEGTFNRISPEKLNLGNVKVRNEWGVPNQFVLDLPDGRAFQSYNSIIVLQKDGKTYLDEKTWNYSKTTGKYRNLFLGEGKADTERKIKSGEYILTDLNTR